MSTTPRLPWASAIIPVLASGLLACTESPEPPPQLTPAWALDVGTPARNEGSPVRAGLNQQSVFFAVEAGDFGESLIGRVDSGALTWSKQVVAGSMAVSDGGRVHYVGSGIQRIEASGNDISPLQAGLSGPQLVTTYENAAIAVQPDPDANDQPQIVRVSAADTLDWRQTIVGVGRCLTAHAVASAPEMIVVAGADSQLVERCRISGSGDNVWIAALSPIDGRVLWSHVFTDATLDGSTYVRDIAISPENEIFFGGSFGMRALRADGTEIWSVERGWFDFSSLAPLSHGAIAVAVGPRIYLFNSSDGTEQEDSFRVDAAEYGKMEFDGDEMLYVAGQRLMEVEVDQERLVQHAVTALRWSPSAQ